ncbi:putative DNA-binding transcriptional regulator [Escherichia coli]|nr:putative DNA-binding transcriptional regulator [Escherichia coli]
MMKLIDKMTPAELADCLGVARQTINRWVREKQWRTEEYPALKGVEPATGGYRPTGTRVYSEHPCQTPSAYRQSSRWNHQVHTWSMGQRDPASQITETL